MTIPTIPVSRTTFAEIAEWGIGLCDWSPEGELLSALVDGGDVLAVAFAIRQATLDELSAPFTRDPRPEQVRFTLES